MNTPGLLQLKNSMNIARWRWRWAQQGGGNHWRARDLQDLRGAEERTRHVRIWLDLREAKRYLKNGPSVVNLARIRIERARRWKKTMQA